MYDTIIFDVLRISSKLSILIFIYYYIAVIMPWIIYKNPVHMFAKVHFKCCIYLEEEFEDTKGVIGIRRSNDRQQTMAK